MCAHRGLDLCSVITAVASVYIGIRCSSQVIVHQVKAVAMYVSGTFTYEAYAPYIQHTDYRQCNMHAYTHMHTHTSLHVHTHMHTAIVGIDTSYSIANNYYIDIFGQYF